MFLRPRFLLLVAVVTSLAISNTAGKADCTNSCVQVSCLYYCAAKTTVLFVDKTDCTPCRYKQLTCQVVDGPNTWACSIAATEMADYIVYDGGTVICTGACNIQNPADPITAVEAYAPSGMLIGTGNRPRAICTIPPS